MSIDSRTDKSYMGHKRMEDKAHTNINCHTMTLIKLCDKWHSTKLNYKTCWDIWVLIWYWIFGDMCLKAYTFTVLIHTIYIYHSPSFLSLLSRQFWLISAHENPILKSSNINRDIKKNNIVMYCANNRQHRLFHHMYSQSQLLKNMTISEIDWLLNPSSFNLI